jgi:hypothetical protein
MKSLTSIIIFAACAAIAAADVPRKKPVATYNLLWTRSPFTTPPPPTLPPPEGNSFEGWALGGVSPVKGGYLISIINTKKQGESQIIRPDGTVELNYPDHVDLGRAGEKEAFSLVRVDYGKKSWTDTAVVLSSGGKTGTLHFDDTLMVPKASAAAPAAPPAAAPPGAVPPAPGTPNQPAAPAANAGNRPAPRPRVITPAPANGRRQ